MNKKAHTMTELLIAAAIAVLLVASVIGAFLLTKSIYTHGAANYYLQREVDVLMGKVVRGSMEQTGTFGLRSAVSFTIPPFTPAGGRIEYAGTDGNTRAYYITNNTVVYNSPTQSPAQQVVYTPPSGSTLTLLFWEPLGYVDHTLVGIFIAVSQPVGDRTASGSITTYVNLRNIPR